MKKIPVILDTDIGGDIDDTWALAMLLRCPELDLKLVVSATCDTVYRARICAKMLQRAGRSDVAIGVGVPGVSDGPRELQEGWIEGYTLDDYPGTVSQDGVDAMIQLVRQSPEPVTLIAIGPLTNIGEMLKRAPEIAANIHFVGMQGSIDKNHGDKPGTIAEFNVVKDIAAAQMVFRASWKSMTITPLDTCGSVVLDGPLYEKLYSSPNPLVKDVIDNFRIWAEAGGWYKCDASRQSSVLFDTVAVHLAYSTEFLVMEQMRLMVDEEGFTRRDPNGNVVNVAIDWTDRDGFNRFLTERLLSTMGHEVR